MDNKKKVALSVNQDISLIAFWISLTNCCQMYVAQRLCAVGGLTAPGMLLAHQCIELASKSTLRLHTVEIERDRKKSIDRILKRSGRHSLTYLIELGKNYVQAYQKILDRDDLFAYLISLEQWYLASRFGERGWRSQGDLVLNHTDEIMRILLDGWISIANVGKIRLYVPKNMGKDFLWENKFFSEEDITNNPLAVSFPFFFDLPNPK